ncbi:MAG: hypothetical protein R3C97_13365 [Geminicoccaceae bacterium]
MDAHDEYRVLGNIRTERLPSLFGIGMTGEIGGVMFTVIGTVAYRSQDAWGV